MQLVMRFYYTVINSIYYSKMAKFYSIFVQILFNILFEVEYSDLEPSFFTSPTVRLRHQSFDIRYDDESRSKTPLRWNLLYTSVNIRLMYFEDLCTEHTENIKSV